MTDSPASMARLIEEQADDLAARLVERQFAGDPSLLERFGGHGKQRCLEDAGFHLRHLSVALDCGCPSFFAEYVGWARCLLHQRHVSVSDLEANLRGLMAVLEEQLPSGSRPVLEEYVADAIARLPEFPEEVPSSIGAVGACRGLCERYLQLLLKLRRQEARQVVMDALDAGRSIEEVYLEVLQPVQYEVGRLWQHNRITVAQEHFCTAATQSVIAELYPRLFASERRGRRAVVASVGPDLHELGGRMVADLLELAGWDTVFLGANTPGEAIARMAVTHKAHVVALSATMCYHVPHVRRTIAAIRALPECRDTRIVVGGRPFMLEPELWRGIGADGSAADGREAVLLVEALTAGGPS